MQIVGIYNKNYKCSKCGKDIQYGKVTDKEGKLVTKDRKPSNNKYGKESNVLSVAVNLDGKIHPCYADLVKRDYEELTSPLPAVGQKVVQSELPISSANKESLDEFEKVVSDAYIKLYQIATRFAPDGAMTREIHISTMGLMHDYFSYLRK